MTIKSQEIKIPVKGIYQFVTSNPNKIKDNKVILIDGETDEKLTYGELKSKSKKLAAGLIDKAGFKRGNVLAIFSQNKFDYSIVILGAIAAGGKVTLVNSAYTVGELTCQLEDSGANYVVASPSCVLNAMNAAAKANVPHSNIFLFGDKTIKGIKPYSSLISEREINPVEYSPEEIKSTTAYICYSSGTTGKNKGVETTHFNMVANISQTYDYVGDIGVDTIFIGVWPIFHIYGLNILIHFALIKGASVVMLPNFSSQKFCKTIQDYKINVITVTPPMVLSFVNLVRDPNARQYDLSSLRLCITAASPLSRALAKEFTKMFKNAQIKQAYGLTEASPLTHVVRNHEIIPGSIGKPIPNIECKIVSKNGEELGYNQSGELYIRGPNVMKGYLNNQEATNACIDSEGWLRTGDLVTVDNDGNFYIVGRIKELIKYMGLQVPPAELESILLEHESIQDAAVIGIYVEQEMTESPAAYVVLKQQFLPSENLKEEIIDFIARQVADHKKLRGGVLFINQIPRNAAGKIKRNILLDRIKTEHPLYPLYTNSAQINCNDKRFSKGNHLVKRWLSQQGLLFY